MCKYGRRTIGRGVVELFLLADDTDGELITLAIAAFDNSGDNLGVSVFFLGPNKPIREKKIPSVSVFYIILKIRLVAVYLRLIIKKTYDMPIRQTKTHLAIATRLLGVGWMVRYPFPFGNRQEGGLAEDYYWHV